MSTCAIVGINWGDEGKGRMVDLLAEKYDVIVRYQGGNNAGHTVINEYGKFALNLLPSGIFRSDKLNILGCGVVIDLKHLTGEIRRVREQGVKITPDNLIISDRAHICFPFHVDQDGYEEERLGDKKYGSTKRGIAPVYGDKYIKKGIQIGDILNKEYLEMRIDSILEWKNTLIGSVYGKKGYTKAEIFEWLNTFAEPLKDYIKDVSQVLDNAMNQGRSVLFEAQLGALRDIDYGIYPYTSSSSPLASYAPVGCGLPSLKLQKCVGVMKAYSTCVGEGPFVGELTGKEAEALREVGGEYGAATGRPRRVAYFDAVASRYGIKIQGSDEIALTKMDVLSYLKQIPICIGYEVDGKALDTFPAMYSLIKAKPVYKVLDGWHCPINHIRKYEDLPENARKYVEYIEELMQTPIKYVSVGPERDEIIFR